MQNPAFNNRIILLAFKLAIEGAFLSTSIRLPLLNRSPSTALSIIEWVGQEGFKTHKPLKEKCAARTSNQNNATSLFKKHLCSKCWPRVNSENYYKMKYPKCSQTFLTILKPHLLNHRPSPSLLSSQNSSKPTVQRSSPPSWHHNKKSFLNHATAAPLKTWTNPFWTVNCLNDRRSSLENTSFFSGMNLSLLLFVIIIPR